MACHPELDFACESAVMDLSRGYSEAMHQKVRERNRKPVSASPTTARQRHRIPENSYERFFIRHEQAHDSFRMTNEAFVLVGYTSLWLVIQN